MIPGIPAGWEVVILLVVLLLLFGGSRLAGVGKGAGRAIREFKDEVREPAKPVTSGEQMSVAAENLGSVGSGADAVGRPQTLPVDLTGENRKTDGPVA